MVAIGMAAVAASVLCSGVAEERESFVVGAEGEVRFNTAAVGEGILPEVTRTELPDGWVHFHLRWDLAEAVQQDELAIPFTFGIKPDFWWAPHLSPETGFVIGQHVFRSPAIIAAEGKRTVAIVPDLALCGKTPETPWFMDYDAPARRAWIGLSQTDIPVHVLYRKKGGMVLPAGEIELAFFVAVYDAEGQPSNPWAKTSRFLWNRHGRPLLAKGEPSVVPLDRYVEHTYRWAFESWKDVVWQEFDLAGAHVGAPAFIVNVTQSPNYEGEPVQRETLSIWNQAWFSSLRSASGLFRYARRTGREDLLARAKLSKDLALAAPQKGGLFPAVYQTKTKQVEKDDKKYARAEGWDTAAWTNSDRIPWKQGVDASWYHVLDMSWTCFQMLRWYEELEQDQRLLAYARTYGDALVGLQDKDGFFPAWLHPESLEASPVLAQSPEASMSVTFLLKLAVVCGDEKYRAPALKALDAVLGSVAPAGQWEDYETYWSCSQWGQTLLLGKRVERNAMFKQNNLSIFWTAEACLAAYRATERERYLAWGKRTLDELSMCQQVWQPPFIHIPALGGFGVMNGDAEWNDARQSLFAELFLDYYRVTGEAALFERGVSAMRASFVMMYCPENPVIKPLWEKVWYFFGPEDYGFTMENYAHGGVASPDGGGMGTFTIYDWGNGAASEARSRIRDHYGDVYVDRERGEAFGLDAVRVTLDGDSLRLEDMGNTTRELLVVCSDGSRATVTLDGTAETTLP